MKFQHQKAVVVSWHPNDDDAAARVFQSDAGVTTSSSATRQRLGTIASSFIPSTPLVGAINDSVTSIVVASTASFRQATPFELVIEDEMVNVTSVAGTTLTVTRGYNGTSAVAHANGAPVRLCPQDGQSILSLPSGRLILMGGAGMGHAGGPDERVNIIWASDDRARTWSVLLGDTAGSSTRPARAHTFGGFLATFGGVLYVYWLGGDPFYPTGDVFRIPASALDVGGDPNTAWERISTTCPTSGLALYMYGQIAADGNLYVIGGQTSINDGPASKKIFQSANAGSTWTEIGTNTVPANVWGQQLGPLPVKDGKFWICGSGRYDSVVNDFSNAVVTFDGTTWTTVLADGHTQFPKSRYHSTVVFNGRLWRFNGTTWDGVTLDSDTQAAHYSSDGVTWTEYTDPIPWPPTHAQAVVATSDGIYLTAGFQSGAMYVVREHTGPLVDAWVDQGTASKDLSATGAARPIFDASAFGGRGGLVFTRAQFLKLVSKDAGLTSFFDVFVVMQSLSFDASAEQSPNPPCVLVGATDGSSWNNFGILGPDGQLQYKQVSGGYQTTERGSGYNDDRPHLVGVQHAVNSLKFQDEDGQVGSTDSSDVDFETMYTGWDAIGAGYLEADKPEAVIGAVVIRVAGSPSSADFLSKLRTWAARWGVS